MGYIKHHTIVVTDWNESRLKGCHEKAKEILSLAKTPLQENCSSLVSDIIEGVTNGQMSFFIAPDGSKEGWDTSDQMDEKRKELVNWLKKKGGCDFVEIIFGGDSEESEILNANGDQDEEDTY